MRGRVSRAGGGQILYFNMRYGTPGCARQLTAFWRQLTAF
jgi:peroxiredoxin